MVEQHSVGKLVSSPKPPEAGGQRARLYISLPAGHYNCRMQLTLDDTHIRQSGLIVATSMVLIVAQQRLSWLRLHHGISPPAGGTAWGGTVSWRCVLWTYWTATD